MSRAAQAALDPVRVLGYRIIFADAFADLVQNGGRLAERELKLYELAADSGFNRCACTSSVRASHELARHDELVSVVVDNRLKGIYRYDEIIRAFKPDCIFSTGVARA